MPVYVDRERNPYRGMIMSHMLADSLEELHAMAGAIGLRRAWFQNHGTPHYDLCQAKRAIAISLGAVVIDRRATVALIRKLSCHRDGPPANGPAPMTGLVIRLGYNG